MRLSDAVVQASVWPDARSFFEAVGRAVDAMADIDRQLMYGVEGITRRPGTGPRPLTSDPTASAALFAESAKARMEDIAARREAMELIVGAGLAVIEGVRLALGDGRADVLEARYVDRLTWDDVGERVGCTRSTAHEWCKETFDWIDAVGWRRAVEGKGIAED